MSESESELEDAPTHAASMKRLMTKDPDFYEFLKENDRELLNFEDDDELDDEEEESESTGKSLTPETLNELKEELKSSPTIQTCRKLIVAFRVAVHQADSSGGKEVDMSGSELFNDVIKLCLVELIPALRKVLKIGDDSKTDPSKSKQWRKMQVTVKSYLSDFLKMIAIMKASDMLSILLKHVVQLLPFFVKFVKLSRLLLKHIVSLWCTSEETVRVLCLFAIIRIMQSMSKEYQSQALKMMYFAYVRNVKFTSPNTWPMINFMKRSLAEAYSLDAEIAYEHAFVYIRQLSIHLRNAITIKKKESFQTVYNWQYVHCIAHWAHVLCTLYDNDGIKSLIYPLVQTTIGTINLISTIKYIPLRFHLVNVLIEISKATGTYIPVLPLIVGVLTLTDFNKKGTYSVRSVDFSCALKATKSQLTEAGFKDGCISEVCTLLMKYLKLYSHTIGFPELAFPAILNIKSFMKQCKVAKYNQQLKAVLVKIEENSTFVMEKRRMVAFKITDDDKIQQWEQNLLDQGTPISRLAKNKIPPNQPSQQPRKKQKLRK